MPFSYMNDVSEHLSVYQLTNDVLRAAYAKPNLARPEICPIVNVDRLHIRQPILGQLKVTMGVREYESIGTQTPNAGHKDVELLNDRIAVQVSAEAQIENNYGDCISMIAEEQGLALGKALEIWIANAMQRQPLKITSQGKGEHPETALIDCANQWHRFVVPHTIQLLGDWEPTAVCMHPVVWAGLQPIFNGASNPSGNVPYNWMNNQIPGFNCPVVTSTYLPFDKIYVVSAKASAMRCYQYDTMTPVLDFDPVINADTMYAGIWRTVASEFRMAKMSQWNERGQPVGDKQEGNAGIVEITLSGTYFDLNAEPRETFTATLKGQMAQGDFIRTFTEKDNKFSDSEKYVEAMNKDIYDNIVEIGGEYIARQSKLLKAADVADPEPTLEGMKKAFAPPKTRTKKTTKDTEE